MSLIKEYFELTKQYINEYGKNTILLMQVGSFFEVYGILNPDTKCISGSCIEDFSKICELNIVEKNTCVGKDNVVMAGFKDMQIEKYIKKIQEAGFTAVVYVQDEAVKNTTRSLGGIFSPGTYFHTETQNLSNSISCIWIDLIENKLLLKGKYVVVGIANIDIYTGKSNIFQFKEAYVNNPTTYDELERFISIYNPSEVILISNFQNEKEVDSIISYAGINSSLIHKINTNDPSLSGEKAKRVKNCEKQIYQKEILSKFYKFNDFNAFIDSFNTNNIATQAFCFLLDFVYQHNPHLINKIAEPIFENCSTRLTLANHSLKQLNIINDGTVKASKYSCVSQMLNNCLTPMGQRKFLYNFLNPVYNETYLQREYDITEHFLNEFDLYNVHLRSCLSNIKDMSKWERQVFLKKITPKAFNSLYENLQITDKIYDKICQDPVIIQYLKINEPNILEIKAFCKTICDYINKNLDLEAIKDVDQLQNFESNFFQIGVDEELDKKTELLKESEQKLNAIAEYLSSLIEGKEKKSGDYVKVHETEKNNFSLLSTARRCKVLQDALPTEPTIVLLKLSNDVNSKKFNFTVSKNAFSFEKQSASNNVIVNDQIVALCKTISSIKVSMKDLITNVYNKFVSSFEQFQMQLENIINFITLIDVLYTKSALAKKYNYCKPTICKSEKSFVEAKQLRHCLIEQFQNNEAYVSNDITLGNGETNGILLYGTNAVGKTSLIRALGIAVIMAQSGLYVPCSSFNYMPYKYIFTRIIGNDNIFKGLSTFAVEMSELRTILKLADSNSLILGDELCSGTETLSAISIFVAGIQQLHRSSSSFIFATHLHEIVDYTEITSLNSVKQKHMEVIYNRERDELVYDRKLKDGPGNSMYGLEVCKSLSLPQEFLDAAYEIRMKYHPETKSMLSLKTSKYNAKKIVGMCEKCGIRQGKEVHHMQYQKDADSSSGLIVNCDGIMHKNDLANLLTICEECHDEIHRKDTKLKKVKTSKGSKLKEI